MRQPNRKCRAVYFRFGALNLVIVPLVPERGKETIDWDRKRAWNRDLSLALKTKCRRGGRERCLGILGQVGYSSHPMSTRGGGSGFGVHVACDESE